LYCSSFERWFRIVRRVTRWCIVAGDKFQWEAIGISKREDCIVKPLSLVNFDTSSLEPVGPVVDSLRGNQKLRRDDLSAPDSAGARFHVRKEGHGRPR
jgi:hypothetical protein